MKIGIMTYHRAVNYGAILQTYALNKVLSKLNCDCEVIDYRCSKIEDNYKIKSLSECRNLKDIAKSLIYRKTKKEVYNKFEEFRNTYLKLSRPYNNYNELLSTNDIYDKFICGSDQVWNYAGTNFDKAYFLDFVKDTHKRNSYAASFGFETIPEEYKEKYVELLSKFNNISVREKQGREIVKALINRDAEVLIDPVLLLSKEEWSQIAINFKNQKDYILLYIFELTPAIKKFAQNLSRETGCEIVYIPVGFKINMPLNVFYAKDVGPREFLGLFLNAKYVITNSFHGIAFSINFNKEFFVDLLNKSQKVNSRIENILGLFDLRNRYIDNAINDDFLTTIYYGTVNNILTVERNKSLDYLKKIIQ